MEFAQADVKRIKYYSEIRVSRLHLLMKTDEKALTKPSKWTLCRVEIIIVILPFPRRRTSSRKMFR